MSNYHARHGFTYEKSDRDSPTWENFMVNADIAHFHNDVVQIMHLGRREDGRRRIISSDKMGINGGWRSCDQFSNHMNSKSYHVYG